MGDIIEYMEEDPAESVAPVFQLSYRRAALLNHFDEKVTEQQILEALLEVIDNLNRENSETILQTLVDYCAMSMNESYTFYHVIFIELKPGFVDVEHVEISWQRFASVLDATLCMKNYVYLDYRSSAYLKPLHVRLCSKGTFAKLRDGRIH